MKNFFKKFGPLFVSVGSVFATASIPALQQAVAHNKFSAAALASALVFAHAVLPSIFGEPNQK